MPKICRWGNSLGLRLPKGIEAAAVLIFGAFVRVTLEEKGIVTVTLVAGTAPVAATARAAKPLKNPVEW